MNTIAEIIQHNGRTVWCIAPQASVFEALQLMDEKKVGALLVVDEQDVLGVISERDYARKLVLKGKPSTGTPALEIMTSRYLTVRADQTIAECAGLMKDKHVRFLAVHDGERLVGLLSVSDLFRAIIAGQNETIRNLEDQITDIFADLATISY